MNKNKWDTIVLLGKPFTLPILESLHESPKRFTDLNKACGIEKTRTNRIKELKDAHLIETTVKKKGSRDFVHYVLTAEGERVFKQASEF